MIAFLEALETDSGNQHGDGTGFIDPVSSRVYRLATVAGFVVTWWCDDAVREVKVVRIEKSPL